ncbi:MAG: hypothetical protein V4772_08840 [Pseudomonadota bacterium]
MSFDQDPNEQANISGADFAIMCDEMKSLKARNVELEAIFSAPRGTDAQILKERGLTCDAALGAIMFGGNGSQPPPDDSAWLRPFYGMGQRIAELEAAQAVPAGWKLVPIEPTEEMIKAGLFPKHRDGYDPEIDAYKAMLAAAPEFKP